MQAQNHTSLAIFTVNLKKITSYSCDDRTSGLFLSIIPSHLVCFRSITSRQVSKIHDFYFDLLEIGYV